MVCATRNVRAVSITDAIWTVYFSEGLGSHVYLLCRRSCFFFQQASLLQHKELKWGKTTDASLIISLSKPAHSTQTSLQYFPTGFATASAHKRCGAHDAAFREYERLLDQLRDPSQRIECESTREVFSAFDQPFSCCRAILANTLLERFRISGLRCLIATCETLGKASYPYRDRLDKLLSESWTFVGRDDLTFAMTNAMSNIWNQNF